MFKRLVFVVIAGLFIFASTGYLFAQDSSAQEQPKKAENVGNKICPVTGEKIDEKTKVTYEYQGKIYNFCCAGCPDEFKKDPEKYIKKVEEEKKNEQKPQ